MNLQVEEPVSTRSRVVGALVGVALLSSSLLALNGVPRFDMTQLAVSVWLASVAVAVWSLGPASRVRTVGPVLVLGLLGGVVGLSAARAANGDAWDQLALWVLPLLVAVPVAWGAGGARAAVASWASGAVAVAAIANAALVVAQRLGVAFPAPVPIDPISLRSVRGAFDAPEIAAAWFGLAAWLCVHAATSRRARVLSLIGAATAGLGLGMTGAVPELAVFAVAGLLAVLASRRRAADGDRLALSRALVPVLAAAVGFVAAPPTDTHHTLAEVDAERGAAHVTVSSEWPYGEPGARAHFAEAALRYALDRQPFGAGAAAFPGAVGSVDDDNDDFALSHGGDLPVARRAPSPLLEMAGDYGAGPALLLLVTVLGVGLAAWRVGAVELIPAVFVLVAWLAVSPGLLHAGPLALLGLAVGLALGAGAASAGSGEVEAVPPRIGGRLAVVALAIAASATQVLALGWAVPAAAAVVFLGHARFEDAEPLALRAAERQRRFSSELNAANAREFGPSRAAQVEAAVAARVSAGEGDGSGEAEAAERQAAALRASEDVLLAHLERAVQIRPDSADARLRLATRYLRAAIGREDQDDRIDRGRRMLERVVELAPNDAEASRSLANAWSALGQPARALDELERFSSRPLAPAVRIRALELMSTIAEEEMEAPARSASALGRALELLGEDGDPRKRRDLESRLAGAERWRDTGVRPIGEDPHGH
ncbi:MAG: hypothetical protein H6698_03815 [Myxococcales bacterium]|nr:hypothetical protein [Myxococcales bacterium]MCB9530489.1 hypothetical protein [Myxococcales bacterium]MCB9533441.1 hypothetical protein [Myxococcales bacterium]